MGGHDETYTRSLHWYARSYQAYDIILTPFLPLLFIDTMGYAFTFPLVAALGRIPVGAYVHYPTISTDMLARVQGRQEGVTNSDAIANSAALSTGKLLYV